MAIVAPFHRLLYVSRALVRPDVPLDFIMRDILITSTILNRADDVTGLLIAFRGCFAQVLEGPVDAVEGCYRRIEADPRHEEPTVKLREPLQQRRFPRWWMCCRSLSPIDDQLIASAEAAFDDDLMASSAPRVLALLAAVADVFGEALDRQHGELTS